MERERELPPIVHELSFAGELFTLYFIYQNGCEACEAAAPELDAFLARHPGTLAIRLDVNGSMVPRIGVEVKATPTYILKRGDGMVKVHSGMFTAKQLEKWIGDRT